MTSLPIVGAHVDAVHTPGPLEQRLAALWPLARSRLDTLAHFGATLRLRRKFSLRMLRVGELKIKVPALQTPNCDACVDLCCTGPNAIVSLRLRDIAALVDAGFEHAIVPRGDGAAPPTPTWARREADGSVFHQVFPILARDRTGTCTLLTEDRKCGAFPAWPLSCARYPYALDLQSKVVFWAKGCPTDDLVRVDDAPIRVRALVRAVVDAYNERVKDAVILHLARAELDALGVTRYLDVSKL